MFLLFICSYVAFLLNCWPYLSLTVKQFLRPKITRKHSIKYSIENKQFKILILKIRNNIPFLPSLSYFFSIFYNLLILIRTCCAPTNVKNKYHCLAWDPISGITRSGKKKTFIPIFILCKKCEIFLFIQFTSVVICSQNSKTSQIFVYFHQFYKSAKYLGSIFVMWKTTW